MATTRVSDLITIASRMSQFTPSQIAGPCRSRALARIRQAVAYVALQQGRHSSVQIGRVLHRDHTTILHSCKMVPAFMERDQDFAMFVQRLKAEAEKHDPWAVPNFAVVKVRAFITFKKPKLRSVKDVPTEEREEYVDRRMMTKGSNDLLTALLAA